MDILGRRVVLWRSPQDGTVHCLDDACPHRGAALSDGWVARVETHDCVVVRTLSGGVAVTLLWLLLMMGKNGMPCPRDTCTAPRRRAVRLLGAHVASHA